MSLEYYTSMTGVASGQESYYLDAVTDGEPPGVWLGSGAQALGLAGEVEADDLKTLFGTYRHPHTGAKVGRAPAKNRKSLDELLAAKLAAEPDATPERVDQLKANLEVRGDPIGWDMTLAVPKSVTILHTAAWRSEFAAERAGNKVLAQQFRWIRGQVEDAITDANTAGIAAAERIAMSRKGGGSGVPVEWVSADKLVVASFRQHTNRSLEPHLHQHNLVLNRVICADGKIRALDGRDFLDRQYEFSAVGARTLVESLYGRLGLEFVPHKDGVGFEAAIVPDEARELFSERTIQVDAATKARFDAEEERLGRPLSDTEKFWCHKDAQRSSRDAKTHDGESRAEMHDRWDAELAALTGRTLTGIGDRIRNATLDRMPDHLRNPDPSAGASASVPGASGPGASGPGASVPAAAAGASIPSAGAFGAGAAAPGTDRGAPIGSVGPAGPGAGGERSAPGAGVPAPGTSPGGPGASASAPGGSPGGSIGSGDRSVGPAVGSGGSPGGSVGSPGAPDASASGPAAAAGAAAPGTDQGAPIGSVGPAGPGAGGERSAPGAGVPAPGTSPGGPGASASAPGGSPGGSIGSGDRSVGPAVGSGGSPGGSVGSPVGRVGRSGGVSWSPAAVIGEAVGRCALRKPAWTRSDLISDLDRSLPVMGMPIDQIPALLDSLADAALAGGDVVQVSGRGAGKYAAPSATTYAAAGTLAAEAALRKAAVTRGAHHLDRAAVAEWLTAHTPTIGADQRAAVEGIAASDAALTVMEGPAGTGKSFVLGALAGVWADQTAGEGRVFGLAVSKKATSVLRDDGIAASRNVSKWLASQDRIADGRAGQDDAGWQLSGRDVVVVDEASMVSTADLEAVRARVQAAGARLVLAGDHRQLASVEAGGVLGLLDGHAETYALSEVRRFEADWERDASLRLRDGDPEALAEYDKHARLTGAATIDDAIGQAAAAAVADRLDGRTVVVVASSNTAAAKVSARIRDQLVELGQVAADGGVRLGRDGNLGSVGDTVACRRNDYVLDVTNRGQYTVVEAREDGSLVVQPVTTGPGVVNHAATDAPVLLPPSYVAEDVQLGYASTVHAAQGLTVDAAHLVTDGRIDAPGLYVAMTRGRLRNTAHVALAATPDPNAPAARTAHGGRLAAVDNTVKTDARAVLTAGLRADTHPGARQSATVTAERDAAHETSMATITGRLDVETRHVCRARLDRHLDDLVHDGVMTEAVRARFGADQATEHLSRLLRAMEQAGHDPREVLTEAVTASWSTTNLDKTASVAHVVSWRIRRHRTDKVTGILAEQPQPGARIPADIPAAEAERLAQLHTEAERLAQLHTEADARTEHLGRRTAEQAPEWAVQGLGPVPAAEQAEDRADWEAKAAVVAAHREAVGYSDPRRALPRMPGLSATERRASYAAAWQALGRPKVELAEAQMSSGQLLARSRAWQRAKAAAPPNVDEFLKAAEARAEQARHAAARAEAEGRHGEAAGHRAEAEAEKRLAAGYTVRARERADWVKHVAVTETNGEAADHELTNRGITPGDEPDRTTTAEWLTHQADRDAIEDAHRPVTEDDITHVPEADRRYADAWALPDQRAPELDQQALRAEHALRNQTPRQAAAGALAAVDKLSAALALADQRSQEAAHEASQAEHRHLAALEAGRRRRDAADLDAAIAHGHDLDTGLDHGHDAGADAGIDDDQAAGWEPEL